MRATDKFVEIMPVDDVFVTTLGEIELAEGGVIRSYLYTKERGVYALKARLLVPILNAIEMNNRAAALLAAERRKSFPLQAVN